MASFQYYANKQIDKKQWDVFLDQIKIEVIYPYSHYLDSVTKNRWGAYIATDYSWVFPVFYTKKMGFKSVRQPLFTQQLGVFQSDNVSQKQILELFQYLSQKMHFVNMQLTTNHEKVIDNIFTVQKRKNYILDLNNNYKTLYANFSSNTKRNVKKSKQITQEVVNINVDEFIRFYGLFYRKLGVKKRHIQLLKQLLINLLYKKQLMLKAVIKQNEIISVGAWCISTNRIYYLAGVSNLLGFENRSMFLLKNTIIEHFAEQPMIYDFEGSMLDGVARFFEGFGAHPVFYSHIYQNNLPGILKKIF